MSARTPAGSLGITSVNGGDLNILEGLLGARGGGAAQQLGRQFPLNDSQVSSALSAPVPALGAGFQKNMSSPQGLEGLLFGSSTQR